MGTSRFAALSVPEVSLMTDFHLFSGGGWLTRPAWPRSTVHCPNPYWPLRHPRSFFMCGWTFGGRFRPVAQISTIRGPPKCRVHCGLWRPPFPPRRSPRGVPTPDESATPRRAGTHRGVRVRGIDPHRRGVFPLQGSRFPQQIFGWQRSWCKLLHRGPPPQNNKSSPWSKKKKSWKKRLSRQKPWQSSSGKSRPFFVKALFQKIHVNDGKRYAFPVWLWLFGLRESPDSLRQEAAIVSSPAYFCVKRNEE